MWTEHARGFDLGGVFRAWQIATPLADATTVDINDPPADACERLSSLEFDQAPVYKDGKCVGLVLAQKLRTSTTVKGSLRWLRDCTIVSTDAPLRDVLGALCKDRIVLLAGNRGLDSFVTVSDLNRHAVRGHFYLLLSQIEMLLSDIVDATFDGDRIGRAAAQGSAATYWKEIRSKKVDPRPVEFLDLQELSELFESTADEARGWNKSAHDKLTALCKLRTTVMHPTRPLLGGRDPRDLSKLAEDADDVRRRLRSFLPDRMTAVPPGLRLAGDRQQVHSP